MIRRSVHGLHQLQAGIGARTYRALEWCWFPSNTHQSQVSETLRVPWNQDRKKRRKKKIRGNHDIPEEVLLVVASFEFLVYWSPDIKKSKDTGDVEEKGSHDEKSSGAYPVRQNVSAW